VVMGVGAVRFMIHKIHHQRLASIISKMVILSWSQRKGPHTGFAQTPGVKKQTEVCVTAINHSMGMGEAIENHLSQRNQIIIQNNKRLPAVAATEEIIGGGNFFDND